MIHELLNLTRPLFVIDCETTGTDVQKDRIIELGVQRWEASGLTKEWRSRINPTIPIPRESIEVHHITDAMIQGCQACGGNRPGSPIEPGTPNGMMCSCTAFKPAPTFKQLAPNLIIGFKDCDYAGKNVRFDLRILMAEFLRAEVEWHYLGARIVDAERLEQLAVPRSLSHLYEKYTGQKLAGAHGALTDVQASAIVIEAQLTEHVQLPRDLGALHALQWPGWIDGDGKFKFIRGVASVGQWGKYAGWPMKSVPSDYWSFILKNDFSADVKQLAKDAKLGKFPQP